MSRALPLTYWSSPTCTSGRQGRNIRFRPPFDQYDLYAVFVDDGDRLAPIGAAPGCMGVSTAATPYYAPADGDSEIATGADASSSGSNVNEHRVVGASTIVC